MSTNNPQNNDIITQEPGSHPLGTSVGALAGLTAGAAAGIVAGPVGLIIGAIAGGIAGGLAGHHVGEGLNPTEGAIVDDENVVGTGMGLTTGAIIGGTLGTVAGPLGVVAGAALGAGIGGYAGAEAEEVYDNHEKNKALKNDTDSVGNTGIETDSDIEHQKTHSYSTDMKPSPSLTEHPFIKMNQAESLHFHNEDKNGF